MTGSFVKFVRVAVAALLAAGLVHGAHAEDRGAALFDACRACHALDLQAEQMPGPNLAGLIGRRVAGDPAFDYSPVLREAGAQGQTWTAERLDAFLRDPEGMFPGMWMTLRGISNEADRQALVAFLADPASR